MDAKKRAKIMLVAFGIMAAGAIACIVTGIVIDNETPKIIAFFLAIIAVVFLILGINEAIVAKQVKKNMDNPDSFCSKTYGKGKEYTYFSGLMNKNANTAKNAAINAFGALGVIFGGGGVFVSGQNSWDIFVSPDELILNCKSSNRKLNDNRFICVYKQEIQNMEYKPLKHGERIIITDKYGKTVSLDISAKLYPSELIHETFEKLNPTQMPESADGQTPPSEEIFA